MKKNVLSTSMICTPSIRWITLLIVVGIGLVSCKSTPKAVEPVAVRSGKNITVTVPSNTPSNTSSINHKVYWGNTLRKLSKRYYGTERRWKRIYQANRLQIEDPDLIIGGEVLVIPQ